MISLLALFCNTPNNLGWDEAVAATLRLTRQANFSFELRRGTFDIELDGKTIGSLEYSETVEASPEPGQHTLRLHRRRYSSRELSFEAADGDVVNFRCHGACLWPRWALSFVVPNLAISLRRE